jgi:hypothetical protein
LYLLRQFCREPSIKELFGFLAFEWFDHGNMLSWKDIIVKRYQECVGKFFTERCWGCAGPRFFAFNLLKGLCSQYWILE